MMVQNVQMTYTSTPIFASIEFYLRTGQNVGLSCPQTLKLLARELQLQRIFGSYGSGRGLHISMAWILPQRMTSVKDEWDTIDTLKRSFGGHGNLSQCPSTTGRFWICMIDGAIDDK